MRWSLVALGVILWQVPKIIKARNFLKHENLAKIIDMPSWTEDDVA